MEKYILTEPHATGYLAAGYIVLRTDFTSFQIRHLRVCVNKLVSFWNHYCLFLNPIQGKIKGYS